MLWFRLMFMFAFRSRFMFVRFIFAFYICRFYVWFFVILIVWLVSFIFGLCIVVVFVLFVRSRFIFFVLHVLFCFVVLYMIFRFIFIVFRLYLTMSSLFRLRLFRSRCLLRLFSSRFRLWFGVFYLWLVRFIIATSSTFLWLFSFIFTLYIF